MSAPIPNSKPQASLTIVMEAMEKAWIAAGRGALPILFVLAVRAYYRDTMGKPKTNDVGMFDDAFFIVTPFGFSAWNGNTDPSRYGWNAGAGKYMARLKPGVYDFKRLKHKINSPDGYMAFGQGDKPVTVERINPNGSIAKTETGCYGINLHRGGVSGTSSEGCLTVPREQWSAFDKTLADALVTAGVKTFPLVLIEGPIN